MQRYESKLLGVRANEAKGTRVVQAAIEAEAEMREDVDVARNAQDYCCDLLIRLENKAVREAARNTRTSHLPRYLDCYATKPSPANRNRHSISILKTKRRQDIYKRGKYTLGGGSSKAPICHRAKGRILPLRVFCREAGSRLEVIWPCCSASASQDPTAGGTMIWRENWIIQAVESIHPRRRNAYMFITQRMASIQDHSRGAMRMI